MYRGSYIGLELLISIHANSISSSVDLWAGGKLTTLVVRHLLKVIRQGLIFLKNISSINNSTLSKHMMIKPGIAGKPPIFPLIRRRMVKAGCRQGGDGRAVVAERRQSDGNKAAAGRRPGDGGSPACS